MKRLDITAVSVFIVALALLAGVIWLGEQVPVDVNCINAGGCEQISSYATVNLEFSRPVQADQVEKLWLTQPAVQGTWEWLDESHARWRANTPFRSGQQISLLLNAGQVGKSGESIKQNKIWPAVIRQPLVVVLKRIGDQQELYSMGVDGDPAEKQLTHTGGKVLDFKPAPDGETIAMSVVNEKKGVDIWTVRRDGSQQVKLLDCGLDVCTTPDWSLVSYEIVYTRSSAGLNPNGPKGAPRVWLLNSQSGETAPLFEDAQKVGYGAVWSPDGQHFSIWNGLEGGIMVVNRNGDQSIILNSANGDTGSWSPDSKKLYFADIVQSETSFRNVVLTADFEQNRVTFLLGGNAAGDGISYTNPVCSPTGDWLAVAVQPDVKVPGRKMYLYDLKGGDGISLTSDLSRIVSFYSWTPAGDRLLFQSDKLGGKEEEVEIWAVDLKSGKNVKVTNGVRYPRWLP
ncbi:MAG: hypothetical protein LWX83_07685 [Anaerolineae bacterium]|nr:hypothetical protein [Anaerolineae bacterium]